MLTFTINLLKQFQKDNESLSVHVLESAHGIMKSWLYADYLQLFTLICDINHFDEESCIGFHSI